MLGSRWAGSAGELLSRFACGATLLVAGGVKLYQLLTDPGLGVLYGSRWTQTAVVEYEVILGLWVLSGIGFSWGRRIALATFVGFGCVSLYLGLSGEASCGCFGRVTVNPWWTLALDTALALLLVAVKPRADRSVAESAVTPGRSSRLPAVVGVASVGALAGVLMVPIALWRPGTASASADSIAGSRFVLLEPEEWVDKPFPLAEYIDMGERGRLLRGSWVMMFYHHGCPKCQQVLPEYERLAEELKRSGAGIEVAVIEVPRFGPGTGTGTLPAGPGAVPADRGGEKEPVALVLGRLSRDKDWFIKTPCEVRVTAGRVTAVTTNEDALPTGMHQSGAPWPTNP
jgi:thiol-disulfide isomerase/thioredoxin